MQNRYHKASRGLILSPSTSYFAIWLMQIEFFVWQGEGPLYLDDLSVEKVEPEA